MMFEVNKVKSSGQLIISIDTLKAFVKNANYYIEEVEDHGSSYPANLFLTGENLDDKWTEFSLLITPSKGADKSRFNKDVEASFKEFWLQFGGNVLGRPMRINRRVLLIYFAWMLCTSVATFAGLFSIEYFFGAVAIATVCAVLFNTIITFHRMQKAPALMMASYICSRLRGRSVEELLTSKDSADRWLGKKLMEDTDD